MSGHGKVGSASGRRMHGSLLWRPGKGNRHCELVFGGQPGEEGMKGPRLGFQSEEVAEGLKDSRTVMFSWFHVQQKVPSFPRTHDI